MYVNFNPKEGFWQNDLGWVFTDEEATEVEYTESLSTVSSEGQFACVPKGVIFHQEFSDFLSATLSPYLASLDLNMLNTLFQKELAVERVPADYDECVQVLVDAFHDADRKTIVRLIGEWTDIMIFKDEDYGFWFTRDEAAKQSLSKISTHLYR